MQIWNPGKAYGRRFGPFTGAVLRDRLLQFADLTGETRPEYLDRDAARAAGWRDIPAPPTYLFCLQMLDTPDPMGWARELGVPLDKVLHAEQSFRYIAPICVGDIIRCELDVVDTFTKKDGTLTFIEVLLSGYNEADMPVGEARQLFAFPTP